MADKMAKSNISEKRKIYRIVKNDNNSWDLKDEDSNSILESNYNKEELIRNAMERCRDNPSELVIHDINGIIEESRIYKNVQSD